MPRRSSVRLAETIEGLLESTARAVGRELRAIVRAFQADTGAVLKRLERRIDKLERQVGRINNRKNGPQRATSRCKREGCREPALARGLCSRHYQQMRYRKKTQRKRRVRR